MGSYFARDACIIFACNPIGIASRRAKLPSFAFGGVLFLPRKRAHVPIVPPSSGNAWGGCARGRTTRFRARLATRRGCRAESPGLSSCRQQICHHQQELVDRFGDEDVEIDLSAEMSTPTAASNKSGCSHHQFATLRALNARPKVPGQGVDSGHDANDGTLRRAMRRAAGRSGAVFGTIGVRPGQAPGDQLKPPSPLCSSVERLAGPLPEPEPEDVLDALGDLSAPPTPRLATPRGGESSGWEQL